MKLGSLQALIIIALLLGGTKAKADQYGTYCIDINGIERCTIWQWDSKAKKLIKKQIVRTSIKKTRNSK